MYNTGDIIMYASTGICQVENVGFLNIDGFPADIEYYTLQPISDIHREKIYVPVGTTAFMRHALTKNQAEEYLDMVSSIKPVTPVGRNPKATQDFYQSLIGSYDTVKLLTVIVSLLTKKRDALACGKKLNQTQTTFLKRRQDLVYNEFTYVMGTSREEIEQFIEENIG